MRDDVARVLDALAALDCRPRRSGNGWAARCPSHPDRRPSLSIGEGADGKLLLWCGAGCSFTAILAALGVGLAAPVFAPTRVQSARPTTRPRTPGRPEIGSPFGGSKIVAVYDYTDATGDVFHRVGRTSDKSFPQAHTDAEGVWYWGAPPEDRRVLYHLPAVLAAVEAGALVIVCEGEKDCDHLNAAFPDRHDYIATTKPGGAESKWLPQFTATLAGARVLVVADADEAGRHAAAVAAGSLLHVVSFIAVAESVIGKDTSDALAAGIDALPWCFRIVAGESPFHGARRCA